MKHWLEAAASVSGPVFRAVDRHGRVAQGRPLGEDSIGRIVKAAARRAGYDSRNLSHLSSHSLRSGHVTSAVLHGATEGTIMRQTGHTTEAMVRRYVKLANVFRQNSASALGLKAWIGIISWGRETSGSPASAS